ncbi:ABC transporter permease [Candidatus Aerophobetes bacterium]|nr:ABC transporter permease [Candidatus Aerophobetes bacterium]
MVNSVQLILRKWKILEYAYPNFRVLTTLFLIFVAAMILLSNLNPRFFTVVNLTNIMTQCSIYVIMGIGMTLVLTTGGLDISIGSIVGLSTVLMGITMVLLRYPTWAGVLIGLAVATACGAFNGFFIVGCKVPPLIVTLGSLAVFRGLAYVLSEGELFFGFRRDFVWFSRGRVLAIPMPIWLAVIVFILGYYLLNKTVTGRHVTAIGGNEEAAAYTGVRIRRLKFLTYVLSGLLAGVAAIIYTARLNAAQPTIGMGDEIHVLAAVILGGTSLFGGRGTMLGTLLAVVLLQVVSNGVLLAGVGFFWQQVLIGLIFIIVVAFRTLGKREA